MRTVHVVGVPMDLGGARRGVDMGPSAIRYAGLRERLEGLGLVVVDLGNLHVADPDEAAARQSGDERSRHASEIARACEELATVVAAVERAGGFPLVLGGDHSIAMGTLAGIARAGRRTGVIYLDAHGDINTPETSPSGNVHGMPLAVALGLTHDGAFPAALTGSADPSATVLVALRDVDPGERETIRRSGVLALTMADIDRSGIALVMARAIEVASRGDGIHLSLDMDAIDPAEAPGVGTPVRGGLTYREAQLAMELIAATGLLRSIEIAEINPILDRENRTAALAVDLIASALGSTIL